MASTLKQNNTTDLPSIEADAQYFRAGFCGRITRGLDALGVSQDAPELRRWVELRDRVANASEHRCQQHYAAFRRKWSKFVAGLVAEGRHRHIAARRAA